MDTKSLTANLLTMHAKSLMRLAALTSTDFLATPSRKSSRRYVRPAPTALPLRERRKTPRRQP